MSGEVTRTTGRFSERMDKRNIMVFFLLCVVAGENTENDNL